MVGIFRRAGFGFRFEPAMECIPFSRERRIDVFLDRFSVQVFNALLESDSCECEF